MSAFEFVKELPATVGRLGGQGDPLLTDFAAALRDNPSEWAKWPKSATVGTLRNLQHCISKGRDRAPIAFHGGGFEAKCRSGVLYVRFVGAL